VSKKTPTTNDGTASAQASQDESLFDLRLLLRELWKWKLIVLFVTLIGVAIGVNDARKYSPKFVAQMVVAPVKETNTSYSGGGGRLMGAAQSLGFVLGGSTASSSFDHFKQSLGSRDLAKALQKKHGFMQKIFKGSWDPTNNTWIQPKIDENSIAWKIRRFFHLNSPEVPNNGDLANYIGGTVLVAPVKDAPFFSITVEHSERDFALYLLETVYKEADEFLNQGKQLKRERNKQYVKEQLQRTELAEIRSILLGMMMKLEQSTMLASSEPPFTITILEHPWVSTQPTEPPLARIIAAPTAVALALVLIAAIVVVSFRME
jgi:hypothetical protein